jgi:general secretion pathway protein J
MSADKRQALGFTLIEVLIAVFIFSMMAAMAYSGLSNSIKTSREAEKRGEQLHRLQMAMALIQRDLTQISIQQSRDEFGDAQPPLLMDNKGERLLEFSRTGWRNPANQIRSTLQRVGYVYEENELYREHWAHFHRGANEKPVRTLLLKGVADITFEFLDTAMQWHQQWPPVNTPATVMPIAVRVTIIPARTDGEKSRSRDDDQKFERYFEVPVGG